MNVMKNVQWRDNHGHTITIKNVGSELIPVITRLARRVVPRTYLSKILRLLNPFSKKDDLERIANLLDTLGKTQEQILKSWLSKLDKNSEVSILTIDQEFMGAGNVEQPYDSQIKEVVQLIDRGYPIRLYLHIDCRRKNYMQLVKKYEKYIFGFKIYPLMGVFPYDPRYDELYEYANENSMPIIYHCSRTNINYYRGRDIDSILKSSHYPLEHTKNNNKNKSMNFCNILGIIEVAEKYKNVTVIVAHFCAAEEIDRYMDGDVNSWCFKLLSAIESRKIKNIKIDTSFAFYKEKYQKLLFRLMCITTFRKVFIWGSDYSMNLAVADMSSYTKQFKKVIGDVLWEQLFLNSNELRNGNK